MSVSVICTVKNEEETIGEFLKSLLSQSKKPDEIVIVDGCSSDNTVDIIESFRVNNTHIKLIVDESAHQNIARGRNIAIDRSQSDVVAVTDAGCRLHRDWLKNLIEPLETDTSIDVVAGYYKPLARNEFEQIVAELTFPSLEKILEKTEKFLPSSRSIAFRKKCWRKVGGYPEHLYTAEDTLFDLMLKRVGCKFFFAQDAIVYWRVRPDLRSLFKQYYLYAVGDGEASLFLKSYLYNIYFPLFCSIGLLVAGFFYKLIWLFFLLVVPIYVIIILHHHNVSNLSLAKFIRSIIILSTLLLAKSFGYLIGTFKKVKKHEQIK